MLQTQFLYQLGSRDICLTSAIRHIHTAGFVISPILRIPQDMLPNQKLID